MKPGELFITTSSWDAFHMWKNPHGIWVPKIRNDDLYKHAPYSMIVKSTLPSNTPAMYVGTDGRPHVGVFLVEDIFLEIPYIITKKIED